MSKLSPAAQAVLNAFTEDNSLHDWKHNHYSIEALAAALHVAVDQVVPEMTSPWNSTLTPKVSAVDVRAQLLAIADELEAQ